MESIIILEKQSKKPWLLYWRAPEREPARRKRHGDGIVQHLLFDLPVAEKVVGGDDISPGASPHTRLRAISKPSEGEGE